MCEIITKLLLRIKFDLEKVKLYMMEIQVQSYSLINYTSKIWYLISVIYNNIMSQSKSKLADGLS